MNQTLYLRRRITNYLFIAFSLGTALFGLVWLGFILFALLKDGISSLSPDLFTMPTPPPGSKGGLSNAIIGSVMMSVAAVVVGTPIGLFAGTYLAEYARHGRLAFVVRFVNDICCRRLRSSSACSSMRSWWCRWGISPAGPVPPRWR